MSALTWLLSLSLLGSEPPPPAPPTLEVPSDAVAEAGFVAGTLAIQLRHCGATPALLDGFYQHARRQAVAMPVQATLFDDGFQRGSQHMHATVAAGHAVPDTATCQALWTRLPTR